MGGPGDVTPGPGSGGGEAPALPRRYRRARDLAVRGRLAEARRGLERVLEAEADPRVRALARNDLAALAAAAGDHAAALEGFAAALGLDPACTPARLNLALLEAELGGAGAWPQATPVPAPPSPPAPVGAVRVAILSFLFNWPSTGGGIVHTVELARFLGEAGYDVRHIHARYPDWGVGSVEEPLPFPSEALEFDAASWEPGAIRAAFRRAVDAFAPDYVLITDSWNSKPLLAEAVRGYPYFLRFQAMECLCPLNNVRLLPPGERGGFRQCALHQLANPDDCRACLAENGERSGPLHRAERALCGVGTPAYHESLLRALGEAEALLVVNPLMADLLGPYARDVRVVTAGMDPARFPWPWPAEPADGRPGDGRSALLFAGLAREPMKGFAVLHEAGSLLWRRRRDFELVVTDDPPGRLDEFTRFVGWQGQADLPRYLRAADVLVVPTIAQEALGRTAVEAMAAGRPVVASRLGGLPATVADGVTGLLCEPGDPEDLARALGRLLDDPGLRGRLGEAGRRRFEEHYAWPVIIERHYRPLLGPPGGRVGRPAAPPPAFIPHIPGRVDHERLIADVARVLGLEPDDAGRKYRAYRDFHEAKGYERSLGERKTLCFEEAFVLYAVMARLRPRTIAEVGTQHGRSTRRLLDMAALLGLEARFACFDEADAARCFEVHEAELVLGDLAGRFREAVLGAYAPDLIFLDAHGYGLLREAIAAVLESNRPCALAIHDCGRGLCNPHMALSRDDPAVTSSTGVWERHVLAELFGVEDPLGPRLEALETPAHRLAIFDTPHGLGLVLPRAEGAGAASPASPSAI